MSISKGFTLVELLVVLIILGVLTTLGITTYNRFHEGQVLVLATRKLKSNLQAAQTKAMTNKQPLSGCTNFSGYSVIFEDSSYRIAASCDEGEIDPETFSLPNNIVLNSGASSVLFKVRPGGTNLASDLSLEYAHETTGDTISVTITSTGEIR